MTKEQFIQKLQSTHLEAEKYYQDNYYLQEGKGVQFFTECFGYSGLMKFCLTQIVLQGLNKPLLKPNVKLMLHKGGFDSLEQQFDKLAQKKLNELLKWALTK